MNPKITKTITEIEKTKTKISELQARLQELEAQRTDLENTEIIGMVRSLNIPLAELSAVLRSRQSQAIPAVQPEQEDSHYEE